MLQGFGGETGGQGHRRHRANKDCQACEGVGTVTHSRRGTDSAKSPSAREDIEWARGGGHERKNGTESTGGLQCQTRVQGGLVRQETGSTRQRAGRRKGVEGKRG